MSIEIMSQVWSHSKMTSTHLLVMLAISDYANSDGISWPSVSSIAEKARISRRYSIDVLKELENEGEIVSIGRCNGKSSGTNVYVVLVNCDKQETARRIMSASSIRGIVSDLVTTAESVVNKRFPSEPQFTPPSEPQFTTLVNPSSPDPSIETSVETSKAAKEKKNTKSREQKQKVAKEKTTRQPNPLFDAVAEEFFDIPAGSPVNGTGGRVGDFIKAIKEVAPDITPENIREFRRRYNQKYPGLSLRSSDKAREYYTSLMLSNSKNGGVPMPIYGDNFR
jgi:ribosomal protein S25